MITAASMPRWDCRGACGVSSNSNRSRHGFRRNLIPDLLILGVPILRNIGKDEVPGGVSPETGSLVHKAKICKTHFFHEFCRSKRPIFGRANSESYWPSYCWPRRVWPYLYLRSASPQFRLPLRLHRRLLSVFSWCTLPINPMEKWCSTESRLCSSWRRLPSGDLIKWMSTARLHHRIIRVGRRQ